MRLAWGYYIFIRKYYEVLRNTEKESTRYIHTDVEAQDESDVRRPRLVAQPPRRDHTSRPRPFLLLLLQLQLQPLSVLLLSVVVLLVVLHLLLLLLSFHLLLLFLLPAATTDLPKHCRVAVPVLPEQRRLVQARPHKLLALGTLGVDLGRTQGYGHGHRQYIFRGSLGLKRSNNGRARPRRCATPSCSSIGRGCRGGGCCCASRGGNESPGRVHEPALPRRIFRGWVLCWLWLLFPAQL